MTYCGRPVLTTAPNFDNVTHAVMDDVTADNQGSGVSTPWRPTTATRRTITYPFLFGDRASIKAFRVFLASVRGRLDGFWIPLYLTDYALVSDASASATAITIQGIGLAAKVAAGNQFAHLAILTQSKMELYGIVSVTTSGLNEIVTLDRGLDTALVAAKSVCCGAMYGRLGDDEVVIEYQTDAVATANIQFVELPMETLSPDSGSGHIGSVVLGQQNVYLYEFTRGSFVWRYGNYGVSLTIGGNVWTGGDISHGEIETSVEFLAESCDIQLATDDASHPLRFYNDRNATDLTTVSIYESSVDGTTFDSSKTVYRGRISGVSFDGGGKIKATLTSLFRASDVMVPTKSFTRRCELSLYDATCGLSEATYTTSGTVSAYGPNHVDAMAFGAKATATSDPNWFALGRVTIGNEVRLCTGQSGNRLYINAPFRAASIGATVTASAGCDKTLATCATKFSNLSRTFQFPFIPNKNPQYEAALNPQQAGGKK